MLRARIDRAEVRKGHLCSVQFDRRVRIRKGKGH